MINIEDVKKRLINNPEPPEVTEIRNNILNSFNKLEFVEEGHKYYLPHSDGSKEELISVSALTKMFEEEQDWDAIAARYALKHNMTVEEVQRKWLENNLLATNSGTGAHLYGEQWLHFMLNQPEKIDKIILPQYEQGYLIPHSPKEKAIMKFQEDLFNVDSIYPVLVETRVYMGLNDKYKLKTNYAGTFDMLYATKIKGQWKLLIYDYKTNKDLYSSFNRDKGNFLLEPFTDLYDEPLGHYTIQLSAYQLALQQLGYEIADRKLIWLREDETYEKISLPDVTDRIVSALS